MCLLGGAVGGVAGCQSSPPDLEAKGRRVEVGIQGEVELCAGTLRAWDEHVGFVEAELGVSRDPENPMEVFIVDDTSPWCDDVMACYIGGFADATFVPSYAPRAIWHELVHHVVSGSDLGMTDRFLSEGIAGSLGDNWCPEPGSQWPTPPLVTLMARDDIAYEHYPRAAQFVDWVRQEHGTEALMKLVDCIDRGDPMAEVDACFNSIFGEGVDAVGSHFDDAAPSSHTNPAICGGEAVAWEDGQWEMDVKVACGDPAVLNGFRSPNDRYSAVLIDIPRSGNYAVHLQGDGKASLEVEPCFCLTSDQGLLHVPGEDSFWVGEPGRYRLVFRTDDPTLSQLHVRLWPLDQDPQAVIAMAL